MVRTACFFPVALLVTACGGGDSGGGGGGATALPDPCSLITAAEIESLLGASVTGVPQSASTAGGDFRRCTWERKYSPELRTDKIVLSVAAAAAYGSLTGSVPYAIGDEGQVLDQTRGVQITWKKGERSADYRYSLVGAFSGDFEPSRVKAKELAQAANGRL